MPSPTQPEPSTRRFIAALMFIAAVALLLAGTGCYTASDERGHVVPIALYPTSDEPAAESVQMAAPADVLLVELGKVVPAPSTMGAVRGRPERVGRVIPASGMTRATSWSSDNNEDELTLERLLGVARSAGAECLLIVGGEAEGLDRLTALAVLDMTVIGAYLLPSHIVRIESRCSAVAIDVASGRLLATGTSHSASRLVAPSMTVDGVLQVRLEEILQEGRVAAVNAALDELGGRAADTSRLGGQRGDL